MSDPLVNISLVFVSSPQICQSLISVKWKHEEDENNNSTGRPDSQSRLRLPAETPGRRQVNLTHPPRKDPSEASPCHCAEMTADSKWSRRRPQTGSTDMQIPGRKWKRPQAADKEVEVTQTADGWWSRAQTGSATTQTSETHKSVWHGHRQEVEAPVDRK